jgi:hypothetical protein
MNTWIVERSILGSTYWLVCATQAVITAILPPGARVHRHDRRHRLDGCDGWRRAVWRARQADHQPSIDRDPPDDLREISTKSVLELLSDDLHELVWATLESQLRAARAHGRAAPGHALPEEAARAGALAVRWLEDEMRSGFPERAAALLDAAPDDEWLPDLVPDTVEELLALMPCGASAAPPQREPQPASRDAPRPAQRAGGSQRVLVLVLASFDDSGPDDDLRAVMDDSVDVG